MTDEIIKRLDAYLFLIFCGSIFFLCCTAIRHETEISKLRSNNIIIKEHKLPEYSLIKEEILDESFYVE